jgi:hypothetical protein
MPFPPIICDKGRTLTPWDILGPNVVHCQFSLLAFILVTKLSVASKPPYRCFLSINKHFHTAVTGSTRKVTKTKLETTAAVTYMRPNISLSSSWRRSSETAINTTLLQY